MPIINSIIVDDRPQVDGRRNIHEQHTDHNGVVYDVHYLADAGLDVGQVLMDRAAKISADVDSREQAKAVAGTTVTPISTRDFLMRFTPQEYAALTGSGNQMVGFYMQVLMADRVINPSSLAVRQVLGMFEQLGLLAAGRAAEIGRAG